MKKYSFSIVLLSLIALSSFFISEMTFSICMSVFAVFALKELISIRKETKSFPIEVEVMSYILTIILIYNNYGNSLNFNLIDYRYLSIIILTNLIPLIIIKNRKKYSLNDALFLIGSTIFIGFTFNLIVLLRNYNMDYLIYIFLIALFTDLFSYISGTLIGRYKLSEDISEDKTIEGLIFGTLIGTFVPTMFFLTKINISLSVYTVILITFLLSLLGQCGDLAFAFIKKEFMKKELSKNKFGVLNELDSIIFIILGFILILTII